MMRRMIIRIWLLGGVLILGGTGRAFAQETPRFQVSSLEFGVMSSSEHAKIANASCQCFWLEGASGDAAITLYRGFGVAAEANGGTASNITPGVGLSTLTFAAGPRYTRYTPRSRIIRRIPLQIFGQALFGDAHAFNGAFPTTTGTLSHSNSFAMQFGGGANLSLRHGIGVRLAELQYVRTSFPNDSDNSQNDLRISAGITWRIGSRSAE